MEATSEVMACADQLDDKILVYRRAEATSEVMDVDDVFIREAMDMDDISGVPMKLLNICLDKCMSHKHTEVGQEKQNIYEEMRDLCEREFFLILVGSHAENIQLPLWVSTEAHPRASDFDMFSVLRKYDFLESIGCIDTQHPGFIIIKHLKIDFSEISWNTGTHTMGQFFTVIMTDLLKDMAPGQI